MRIPDSAFDLVLRALGRGRVVHVFCRDPLAALSLALFQRAWVRWARVPHDGTVWS